MQTEWEVKHNFRYIENSDSIKLKGYIDKERCLKFTSVLLDKVKASFKFIEGDQIKEKHSIQSQINGEDLANFIFIRSIFDYGNIAPSSILVRP